MCVSRRANLCFAVFLLGSALAVAQTPPQKQTQSQPQKRTLSVNGHTGTASFIQWNGHSYVDIESLARIANGSLGFKGNQITLTLAPPAATKRAGLSRDFVKAGIEQLGAVRELVTTLGVAVRNGYPVAETWIDDYRRRADEQHKLARVSAVTPSDQQAMQLLDSQFGAVQSWDASIVAARKAMNAQLTMNPSTVDNDPVFQKLTACSEFLYSMLLSGQFEDSPNCH